MCAANFCFFFCLLNKTLRYTSKFFTHLIDLTQIESCIVAYCVDKFAFLRYLWAVKSLLRKLDFHFTTLQKKYQYFMRVFLNV